MRLESLPLPLVRDSLDDSIAEVDSLMNTAPALNRLPSRDSLSGSLVVQTGGLNLEPVASPVRRGSQGPYYTRHAP